MMIRISSKWHMLFQSTLAVLLVSQCVVAAPQPANTQRPAPESAPKKQALVRPARPAKMEPSQPVVGSEVFVERFDDGKVKVEREVDLDAEGNYVNHGSWRMWNRAGKLMAEGSFDQGQRTGVWSRWYDRADSPLLNQVPFHRFKAPFLSQVNFENGVMNGEWCICDALQNRCCQIAIGNGKRNGMSLFWMPDGNILQQSTYDQGVPTGNVLQIEPKTGKLAQSKSFLNGREKVTKKSSQRRGSPAKFEANYLAPTSVLTQTDNFWTLQFAKYEAQGEELRHGKWEEWYSNGQLKMSGQYNHDKKVGQFSYWYPNGQKATEGNYSADKHDGIWVWWHQNGQKSVTGNFRKGHLVDQWRWWAVNGKLTKQMLHDGTRSFESLVEKKPASILVPAGKNNSVGTTQEKMNNKSVRTVPEWNNKSARRDLRVPR